jgi:hypothetical protein
MLHTLKISTEKPQNMEEMLHTQKTSTKTPQNVEEMLHTQKMSWTAMQIQDKYHQKGNLIT